jgi:3-dehydro-L-gulonate 2-dehydrogenase
METRVPIDDLIRQYTRVLEGRGLAPARAALCARLFAETDRDGVYSHGMRRFGSLIGNIDKGFVNPKAEPVLVTAAGPLEQWDSRRGVGNLAAWASMGRAMELAAQHGVGCVGLRNTTHWMRAGTYGWQAAEAGYIGICWTNTMACVPPWGAKTTAVGNNPLVVAVPRKGGHVVLDMAMTQFSIGRLALYREWGEPLPVDGGYDKDGRLSRSAEDVLAARRFLPAGLWKGAGLALLLDMMAAMLSGGDATFAMQGTPPEASVSQAFIAIDPGRLSSQEHIEQVAQGAVALVQSAEPMTPGQKIQYPGQRVLETREENLRLGVPANAELWQKVKEI